MLLNVELMKWCCCKVAVVMLVLISHSLCNLCSVDISIYKPSTTPDMILCQCMYNKSLSVSDGSSGTCLHGRLRPTGSRRGRDGPGTEYKDGPGTDE